MRPGWRVLKSIELGIGSKGLFLQECEVGLTQRIRETGNWAYSSTCWQITSKANYVTVLSGHSDRAIPTPSFPLVISSLRTSVERQLVPIALHTTLFNLGNSRKHPSECQENSKSSFPSTMFECICFSGFSDRRTENGIDDVIKLRIFGGSYMEIVIDYLCVPYI